MELTADSLSAALADTATDAGIVIRTSLLPLGGPYSPVKPAAYEGGKFQCDRRWDDRVQPPEAVDVVVIDNVPSQANRLEAALEILRAQTGLPEMVLDLSGLPELPPHLPRTLSSFRFPHRHADAYLRDALLDGASFPTTDIGKTVLNATADRPEALLQWFPQSLLFGFWHSHLGKKRSQAKLARSWVSEVIGYRPATVETRTFALKGDPLNLSVTEPAEFDPDDLLTGWGLVEGGKKAGAGKAKDRLSELGHGQVLAPTDRLSPAGVSFERIEQHASLSFAGLRRISAMNPAANRAGRALLAAIGITAHTTAFGRAFSLRSGCDLVPASTQWTWLGSQEGEITPPTVDGAVNLLRDCARAAEDAGLPVGSRWADAPLRLTPADNLADAIRRTWPTQD
ncbi:MAG: type I-G CRISPR-associated RAMP protein Csb1/Cas7g [Candidatus Dormibacteria bacterium]